MPRILKTRAARADYRDIFEYVAEQSWQNAESLLRRFDSRLLILASHHLMGRLRPELGQNLRSFPDGNYVIFYRPIDDGIELIRVLHSARDISPEYFTDS